MSHNITADAVYLLWTLEDTSPLIAWAQVYSTIVRCNPFYGSQQNI